MMQFLFIGDRRSVTAIKHDWTWADARLAAKTLHDALQPLGLVYGLSYDCTNLFTDEGHVNEHVLSVLGRKRLQGIILVSMGRKVDRMLARYDLPHLHIAHPAARGLIRRKEVYTAHVQHAIFPLLQQSRL